MEANENIDVALADLSAVMKFKQECVKCKATGAKDLRLLSNCEHLLCIKCTNAAASKCPKCAATIKKKDSLVDDGLTELLCGISTLGDAAELLGTESYSMQIVPFFTHELTVNKLNHKGETRLHKECRDGNVDKVEALLQAGVDPNLQDFAGWTALHEAVAAGEIETAKLLLDYGAFVNTPGLNYDTPLHTALQENNLELVKLLVQYGAALLCYNKEGKTPIDLCKSSDELRRVCLTQRRPHIYKVYTIPTPKVFCLDVSPEDVRKLSESSDITIRTEQHLLNINESVTYMVVGTDDPSLLYLCAALLRGSCIVTTKWIGDYITKKNIIPFNYVPDVPQFSLHKAMLNSFNKLPRLFDGLHFYFLHSTTLNIGCHKLTISDFKLLINLGGGKVGTRKPNGLQEDELYYPYHASKETNSARTIYYLIYDELKQDTVIQSNATGIKYKSSKWLIDCIRTFSILE